MKRLVAFLTLLFLTVPALQVYTVVSEEIPLTMEPSMRITLFPDGCIGIEYKLHILAKQSPNTTMDGKILFSLDYFEDKNSAGFGMGGGGELAIGNITGDPLNVTSLSIMGDLTLRSREVERKAVVNALY